MSATNDANPSQSDVLEKEIPEKLYFKIGEVCSLVGVEAHVIRYWEQVFSLPLRKSPAGQRRYRRQDVERFRQISRLLYVDGFTIAGAKKVLTGRLSPHMVDSAECNTLDVESSKASESIEVEVENALSSAVGDAESSFRLAVREGVRDILLLIKAARALSE